ncbi:MAG: GNAT family N-acetyltransferase [Lentimicrobium sp.]|nr:GNAT family N-acetyltransferase [Lentimicrobium sp.]
MVYLSNMVLPEGLIIRKYQENDYPEVESFWNKNGLGGSHRGDSIQIVENTLAAGGHLLVMLASDGEIAGTSWLTNDKRRTYLHHFGIAEIFRGKGLSKILLEESLKLAAQDGFQVKIEVHRENLPALNLYKKAGFKYLGDYDVYMIRDFSQI